MSRPGAGRGGHGSDRSGCLLRVAYDAEDLADVAAEVELSLQRHETPEEFVTAILAENPEGRPVAEMLNCRHPATSVAVGRQREVHRSSSPPIRRRAVELAREKTAPASQVAKDLGISESYPRNWMARADIDDGKKPGLTSEERKELVRLRRDKRRLETENEVLRPAAAFFAWEIGPKLRSG